jgi:hypothetical protein
MLLKGSLEYLRLLWRWPQSHADRSVHVKSISYITLYCQQAQLAPVPKPHERSDWFLSMAEARSLPSRS